MHKKILLIGPRACGKTRNAEKIASFFGVKRVFEIDAPLTTGVSLHGDYSALFICNELPLGISRKDFDIVIEVNRGDLL